MTADGHALDIRCVRVVVSGRVQGVWFRGSMVREATRLGLTGWVKNRADGLVEAHVEGPETGVDRMLAWCRRGPDGARVDSVTTSEQPPAGFSEFTIEY